ncbi:hypothetical protein ACFL59_10260 [Planctomycetota bacterium]
MPASEEHIDRRHRKRITWTLLWLIGVITTMLITVIWPPLEMRFGPLPPEMREIYFRPEPPAVELQRELELAEEFLRQDIPQAAFQILVYAYTNRDYASLTELRSKIMLPVYVESSPQGLMVCVNGVLQATPTPCVARYPATSDKLVVELQEDDQVRHAWELYPLEYHHLAKALRVAPATPSAPRH